MVELRVHGVSAGGAAEVLGRPLVRQVAGDRSAGSTVLVRTWPTGAARAG
ncbi:hypothetical protein V2I01_43095 [Micromonospora sp. BRA006-A]|nr:hypothetical protein [Micromonospora sp. BRA006-A]